MQEFISYIVTSPMRWDTLANIAYGDPTLIEPLKAANQSAPSLVIPDGSALLIPILPGKNKAIPNDSKPPWA